MAVKTAKEYLAAAGGDASKAMALMAADLDAAEKARTAAEEANKARLEIVLSDKADANGFPGTGVVMVKGVRRFPVGLYASEWQRLAPFVGDVLKWIDDHKDTIVAQEKAYRDYAKAHPAQKRVSAIG